MKSIKLIFIGLLVSVIYFSFNQTVAIDTANNPEIFDRGFDEDTSLKSRPIYGNNISYSTRTIKGKTVQVYYYDRGKNKYKKSNGCGNYYKKKWLRMDKYNHKIIQDCTSSKKLIKFTKIKK